MKPVFFISSTIKDFKDLRSCIKWWLEENEYTVNASEFNDFKKPLDKNTYKACLNAIDNSNYFILLLGEWMGGMYNKNITITQKEYRYAYQRMLTGKLKIINIIRKETWTIFEHTNKNIKELGVSGVDDLTSANFVSKDDKLRYKFIDEVRRVKEMKKGKRPKNNWIHPFNTFKDITDILKNELGDTLELSYKQKRYIILTDLKKNLKLACSKLDGELLMKGYMSSKLFENFHINLDDRYINLTNEQWVNYASFYVACMQTKPFIISRLETYYKSGFFLDYDKDINDYISGNLNIIVTNLLTAYENLNNLHKQMYEGENNKLAQLVKKADQSHLRVTRIEIMYALDYSDNLVNCMFFTKYLYRALSGLNYKIPKFIVHNWLPKELQQKEPDIVTDQDIENFLKTE